MSNGNLKSQTKSGLYWRLGQQVVSLVVSFFIGIAMARVLTPEDYGITALPAVFIAVSSLIIGNGSFGAALVRKQDITESDLSTVFYYSLGMGFVLYLMLWFASPWIADFYNTPILEDLMHVTSLSFLYGALGTPQKILLQRRLDFKTPAIITITCLIISGVVGLSLAYTGHGVWALVISNLVSGLLSQLIMLAYVRWWPKAPWSHESFKYIWGYGNKFIASGMLDTLYNNITPVIVGKYYSPASLGEYNRAQNYANLPSSNITNVLQSVTFPVLSKLQDDPDRMINGYRRMIRVSAFLIFPAMMLLAGLARPLVITMITDKWEGCIYLLQIMCFSMMWYPIHAINLNILTVTGRTDLFLKLEIIKKILGLSFMCCFLPLGLVAFCYANIGSSLLCLVVNSWYTGKLYNFGIVKQFKDLIPILTISLIVFVVSLSMTFIFDNMIVQIVSGILVSVVFYIGSALLLKFKEIEDVKFLLKKK